MQVEIKDNGILVIPGEGRFRTKDLTPEVYDRLKKTYPSFFKKQIDRKIIIETTNGKEDSISE